MAQAQIIHSFPADPSSVVTFQCGAEAIETGDLVSLTVATGLLIPADTLAEDITFLGVAMGSGVAGSGTDIPVALKCIAKVACTSGTYLFGSAIGMTATANTVVNVTTGAGGIGWVWDQDLGTKTYVNVLFDVVALNGTVGKLIEAVAVDA